MTGGDFSADAYQALREAYAGQLSSQEELEQAGVQVMGQRMTMETLPVDSPWRDKIESWTYPSGKSAYTDGPQKSPEEVLQLMRDAAAERDAQESDEGPSINAMSDEEFDKYVDQILAEDEDEDEGSEGDEETISDEEIDALISELLDDEDEEEVEETVEEEVEEVVAEQEEVVEEAPEEEAEYDPEAVQAELESLRQELDAMRFTPDDE